MFATLETTDIRRRTRKYGENESIAETDTTGMPDFKHMKKGQHSLVESVTLKAPKELLYYSYVLYTSVR